MIPNQIVNKPDDKYRINYPPPDPEHREYFECSCGSTRFYSFNIPGNYSTWVECQQCGQMEEVHQG